MTNRHPMLALALALSLCASGCSDDSGTTPDSTVTSDGAADTATPDGATDTSNASCAKNAAADVVTFDTDDGVKLEADLYLSGNANAPVAVLLHMVPPANNRTNYPAAFIEALLTKGISVLNVDRRGAGGSQGNAMDAYVGDKGKLDAKAAVDFLGAHGCPMDLTRLALIGASNGTTTVVDYTVAADGKAQMPSPAALVFLSGGSYTETQSSLAANLSKLQLPLLFAYPAAEKAWNEGFKTGAPASWQFHEYTGQAHGTGLFSDKPESIGNVADFVASAVGL